MEFEPTTICIDLADYMKKLNELDSLQLRHSEFLVLLFSTLPPSPSL
jgi:hypothetical protein